MPATRPLLHRVCRVLLGLAAVAALVALCGYVAVCVIDVATDPSVPHGGPVQHVEFCPDGAAVLSASYWESTQPDPEWKEYTQGRFFGEIKVWDVATGRERVELRTPREELAYTRGTQCERWFFLAPVVGPGGRQVAVTARKGCGAGQNDVWYWADALERRRHSLRNGFTSGLAPPFAVSPGGNRVAVHRGPLVELLDARTLQSTFKLPPDAEGMTSLVFSEDGRFLAIAGIPRVECWNLTTELRTHTLNISRESRRLLGLSHGGSLLASLEPGNRRVTVWDVAAGKALYDLPRCFVLRFSPDGTHLAAESNHGLAVHDARTGRVARSLGASGDPVTALAFNAGGDHLAVGTQHGRVRVYNLSR